MAWTDLPEQKETPGLLVSKARLVLMVQWGLKVCQVRRAQWAHKERLELTARMVPLAHKATKD